MPTAGLYKLKASIHLGQDYTQPRAVVSTDARGNNTYGRRPSRTYTVGEVVPSDTDLVAKFGAGKFEKVGEAEVSLAELDKTNGTLDKRGRVVKGPQRVMTGPTNPTPGDPTPLNLANNPGVFPHGQISTGHQQAAPKEQAPVRSGPASDEVKEMLDAANPGDAESLQDDPRATEDAKGNGRKGKLEGPQGYGSFDDMSLEDLKSLAAAEEIPLGSSTKKADIIRKMREADAARG